MVFAEPIIEHFAFTVSVMGFGPMSTSIHIITVGFLLLIF